MFPEPHAIGLYFVGFISALVGSLGLTYVVREQARRRGLFDQLSERKVHTEPVPRIGGVGIYLAVSLTLLALFAGFGADAGGTGGSKLAAVLGGGSAMHLLGLWDDLRPMRARTKLAGQIVIAIAVFFAGVTVSTLSLPFVGVLHFTPPIGLLITVFWFVGITNAFNLIDGLDGLASGAALFALTTMFVVASINGQIGAGLVTIVLAGATLGFLVYNWHPASIFLGDSGSLFIGFMLAGIGLLSSQKGSTVVAVAIPVVALGLPVLDTALAIVRRFLRGQPIFSADRGHIHHRLLGLGHSPRNVALLMLSGCAVLALGGMLLVNNTKYVALLLVIVGLGIGVVVQRLRFHEFEELARVVRRGWQQRDVIARRVRIREASGKMSGLDDLDEVFAMMQQTFEEDQFQRAEVRMRRGFLSESADVSPLDRRLEDDVEVWSWSRDRGTHADWWEIKLPLLDASGIRVGSLVLWQDGLANETSLSHMHAIAGEFRQQVQQKVLELWHFPDSEPWAARGRRQLDPVSRTGGSGRSNGAVSTRPRVETADAAAPAR